MKLIFIILLFQFSLSAYSQYDTTYITHDNDYIDDTVIYVTDTIINKTSFGRPILIGTTVLPETSNSMNARGHGFFLKEIIGSPCKIDRRKIVHKKEAKVASILKTDSTWTCDLNIVANCCHDFLCEISIVNDTTLNFIYHGYGATYCACNCCFGLTYKITLDDYSEDEIENVTHTMVNGDEKTLNKIIP